MIYKTQSRSRSSQSTWENMQIVATLPDEFNCEEVLSTCEAQGVSFRNNWEIPWRGEGLISRRLYGLLKFELNMIFSMTI